MVDQSTGRSSTTSKEPCTTWSPRTPPERPAGPQTRLQFCNTSKVSDGTTQVTCMPVVQDDSATVFINGLNGPNQDPSLAGRHTGTAHIRHRNTADHRL